MVDDLHFWVDIDLSYVHVCMFFTTDNGMHIITYVDDGNIRSAILTSFLLVLFLSVVSEFSALDDQSSW